MDAGTSALYAAVATGVLSLTGVVLNSFQARNRDKNALPDSANTRLNQALDRVSKQAESYAARIEALESQVSMMQDKIAELKVENQSLRQQLSDARLGES